MALRTERRFFDVEGRMVKPERAVRAEVHHFDNGKLVRIEYFNAKEKPVSKRPRLYSEDILKRRRKPRGLRSRLFSGERLEKGGPGSGNFGHSGRPGEIGGSGSGGGAGKAEPKPGRNWIDHKEGTPTLDKELAVKGIFKGGTFEKYKVGAKWNAEKNKYEGGEWSPERKKLHDKIVSDTMDHVKPVPPDQKPIAVIMMGGPGSGKSSMIRGLDKADFVEVNADLVKSGEDARGRVPAKTGLPEYREAVAASARDAAAITHEESSELSKRIRDAAIDQNKNLIFDGTGNNINSYTQMINTLKAKGYEVTLMMPDLDLADGLERVRVRAEKEGRYVPDEVVKRDFFKHTYATAPRNFEPLTKLVDNFQLFDNRVPKGNPPRLVWSRTGGKETVHDESFVRDFRAKHK